MKKICFIAPAKSIHTQKWVRTFALSGHYDVTLISPYGAVNQQADFGSTHLICMPPPSRSMPILKRYLCVLRNFTKVRLHLLKNNYDLIHIHQLPPTATSLFFWRIPRLVISTWGGDILDVEGSTKNRYREISRQFILKQATAITATSRYLASVTHVYAPLEQEVHVVPFGVDMQVFKEDPSRRPHPPLVRMIIVKHLRPICGIHYLLQALKIIHREIKEIELLIVGEGPERDTLGAMTKQLGLQNVVRFLGHVSNSQVVNLLQSSHIFVMPSLTESFGVAAVEAQAVGLPVVASQVGGIPEVVLDNQSGILVPPGNVDALSQALITLINNPKLRECLGCQGQHFVQQHYDWRVCVEQMEYVYRDVLSASD